MTARPTPRPKNQVFISSTFHDLKDAREQVTWAVLETRNIPAGMEAFPSTDDRGWEIIRRLIDRTDYYVLLLAGRYGSYDEEVEMSWTHREYCYAREQGVPILAFKRSDEHITKSGMEQDPAQQQRLREFLSEVSSNHKWTEWTTPEDLARKVSISLTNAIQDDLEQDRPRPGWYRGDTVPLAQIGSVRDFPIQASLKVAQTIQLALQNVGTTLAHGRTLRVVSTLGTVAYRGLGTDGKSLVVHHATGPCAGTAFTVCLGFGYVLCTRWISLEPLLGFPVRDEFSTPTGSQIDFEGGRLKWTRETGEVQVYSDLVDGGRLVSTIKLGQTSIL